MDDNFSPRVKDVISYSKEEALRLGHDHIGTEHLMLGILRDGGGKAISIFNAVDWLCCVLSSWANRWLCIY